MASAVALHSPRRPNMTRFSIRSLVGFSALAFLAPAALTQEKKPAPEVPPLKGERGNDPALQRQGFVRLGRARKYWSVQDGVIVGKNTEPVKVSTYLLTKRKFSDFRLVFEFKLAKSEMHSGIAMWGRIAPERMTRTPTAAIW